MPLISGQMSGRFSDPVGVSTGSSGSIDAEEEGEGEADGEGEDEAVAGSAVGVSWGSVFGSGVPGGGGVQAVVRARMAAAAVACRGRMVVSDCRGGGTGGLLTAASLPPCGSHEAGWGGHPTAARPAGRADVVRREVRGCQRRREAAL